MAKFLILGGTGTLGTELVSRLRINNEVTVLSRDEHKHQKHKKQYPQVKYVLGDIRDKESMRPHFRDVDVVFHCAALKHIDHLEENPVESVKTNILGSINVADLCVETGIKNCVFSSTDKAIDPHNVYGQCKAISSSIFFNYNENQSTTRFGVFVWGNILASAGSILPYFVQLIDKGEVLPLTHLEMSRFFLPIEVAVDFMIKSFQDCPVDRPMVHPKMGASKITIVAQVIASMMGKPPPRFQLIGLRRGEKIHECLISMHSKDHITSETAHQYSIEELKELLLPVIETGLGRKL